jgi:DNA-binding MurR/RpiR family transcriptional regulator
VEIRTTDQLAEFFKEKGAPLSDTFRRIAEFILSQYQVACFMNASELAVAIGVSQPSVTRFITHLGFESYSQFSRILQKIVLSELKAKETLSASRQEDVDASPHAALIESEIANLRRLGETFASSEFQQAARQIAEAERVLVIGLRSARGLAEYLGFFLNKIHPGVSTHTSGGLSCFDHLIHLESRGTVAIVLSFPRNTSEIAGIMDFLRGRGIPLLLITDSLLSPLAAKADRIIRAPVSLVNLFDSYSAPITLLNVLVSGVAQQNKERSEEMLKAFEVMAGQRGIFLR